MRKLALILAVAWLAIPGDSLAAGQACVESFVGDSVECHHEAVSIVPVNQPAAGSRPSSTAPSGPAKKYLPHDKIMLGPDGQACIGTGYYEDGTGQPIPAQGPGQMDESPGNSSSLYSTAPPCPAQPRLPGQTGPVETPAMVARRYWEQIPLPKPRPQIAPGRAITGKLAYLETRSQTSHTYTNDTAFGPLEILAKGSYIVDWGDGETTGPYDLEGKPWPNGQITHEYVDIGAYDVVVTEKWTATWRLGGQSGVLRTLQTTGTIGAFPVEQLQAVIGR